MPRRFDDELKTLREQILKMGYLVETALNKSVKGLRERNHSLISEVISEDKQINMLEIDIDELCLKLFALFHPEAGDLRFVISCLRINAYLERIGDLAVNIAERTQDLLKINLTGLPLNLWQMADSVKAMLKDSIDAFVNNDPMLAEKVYRADDVVDDFNRQIFKDLFNHGFRKQDILQRSLELFLIAKNLERIADLTTNIAEAVIYIVEAKVIKHHIADHSK